MPTDKHPLAELRSKTRLTQTELAELIFTQIESVRQGPAEYSRSYVQKRVSLWERGNLHPNAQETEILARLFGVTRDEIGRCFDRLPTSPQELYNSIAEGSNPTLISVCYGGPPRRTSESELASLADALSKNAFLAIYCPYPSGFDIPGESGDERGNTDAAMLAYHEVRLSILRQFEGIYSHLVGDFRTNRLALYCPRTDKANIMLPLQSRQFVYVVEFDGSTFEPSAYIRVESRRHGVELFQAGNYNEFDPYPQAGAWRGYFGKPITEWLQSGGTSLPGTKSNPNVGQWIRKFSEQDRTV